MVKALFLSLIFTCTALTAALSLDAPTPASIDVQIPDKGTYEERPVVGTISIIREARQTVAPNSFTINGQPLKVQFVGDEHPAPENFFAPNDPEALVVSKYQFTLPPQRQGLYTLPPISATIGGNVVASNPITYEVYSVSQGGIFSLEATVDKTSPLYPGQKCNLTYTISFRVPIELTTENLPMLKIDGFRNIGAPKIETFLQGSYTVQRITQTAAPLKPGTFSAPESVLEGHVYTFDQNGQKLYGHDLVRATAPAIAISVAPFPEVGKPDSFTGTIGNFVWKARLLTSPTVNIGEKMQLELIALGPGEISTVSLPDIAKQEGFVDAFRLSDLPPTGEAVGDTAMRFVIELRPLSASIKQIPAIQFSSFDPQTNRYITSSTVPLTIHVLATADPQLPGPSVPIPVTQIQSFMPANPPPIEILTAYQIESRDLVRAEIGITLLLGVIFLCTLFLVVQIGLRIWLARRRSAVKIPTSRELFLQALQIQTNPVNCFALIRQSLLLRLHEQHQTPELCTTPQQLEQTGIQGDIRAFLFSLDATRFSGLGATVAMKELTQEAAQLYQRIPANVQTKPSPTP